MTLIGPFRQLLPMSGLPLRGPLRDTRLTVLENAGLMEHKGLVHEVGSFANLETRARKQGMEVQRLEQEVTAFPGFIDSHTHICFAGSRAADYAMRNTGLSYLEIARAGGGIMETVGRTREASAADLVAGVIQRATRHLLDGVTTVEVKSGYGLSVQEELKLLRAIREASRAVPPDLVPTCLAAHVVPSDFPGRAAEYLQLLAEDLLPAIKVENLCSRVDAFVEESAFSPDDIAPYFSRARELGFDLTVHADQFTSGGSELAVRFGALSADHLEASTPRDIERLGKSQVIATALPGASLGLGCGYAPARALLDAGACLAIASDWNPGSAPMGRLLLQASLLGAAEKLSHTEVLAGITCRAAAALGLSDRGSLATGNLADLVAFPVGDYREVLYQQGSLRPAMVWKKGVLCGQELPELK